MPLNSFVVFRNRDVIHMQTHQPPLEATRPGCRDLLQPGINAVATRDGGHADHRSGDGGEQHRPDGLSPNRHHAVNRLGQLFSLVQRSF